MRERFGIDLDPQTEICALIGSKEGIAHAPLALVNPGETELVPDPAYPVYRAGTMFAGGEPVDMPLREENGFLPDFQEISDETAERASVMFLNYPNNPTGATVDENFFDQAVDFAATHDLTVLHDAAYSELCFADYRAPSILQVPSAKERCVEFHSLSKTFNMTGWRLGFVAGNAQVVGAIGRVKTNIDSGVFEAVQQAGIAAYSLPEHVRRDIAAVYRPRRDVVLDGLRRAGIAAPQVRATFYVWFPVPGGDSTAFASRLLEKTAWWSPRA
jgi:LL-diaminopimelate aminotransferase